MTLAAGRESLFDWAVASAPIPGEVACGDVSVVEGFRAGALLAAIDGVGHGPEAAVAAQLAATTLRSHAGQPVIALMRRCHEALRRTRGAVVSMAAVDGAERTMSWVGVGNVDGVLIRSDRDIVPRREAILVRGGVVGLQLPPLQATVIPIAVGDVVVFATDGIRPDFHTRVADGGSEPQYLADQILTDFRKANDDALVLVARFLGGSGQR